MTDEANQRIADLLDAYGSDFSRWPAAARALIADHEPRPETARKRDHERDQEHERSPEQAAVYDARDALVGQTVALDRLLQRASQSANDAPPPSALMARIMRAAESETAPAAHREDDAPRAIATNVVALDAGRRRPRPPQPAMRKRDWTAAAALLAASLLLGIFIGSNQRIQATVAGLGEIAGVTMVEPLPQLSALDAGLQALEDEDLL